MTKKKKASKTGPTSKKKSASKTRRTGIRTTKTPPRADEDTSPGRFHRMAELEELLKAASKVKPSDPEANTPITLKLTLEDVRRIQRLAGGDAAEPYRKTLRALREALFPRKSEGGEVRSIFPPDYRSRKWRESAVKYIKALQAYRHEAQACLSRSQKLASDLWKSGNQTIARKDRVIAKQAEHLVKELERIERELQDVYVPVKEAMDLWARVANRGVDHNMRRAVMKDNSWIRTDQAAPMNRPRVHAGDWMKFLLQEYGPVAFDRALTDEYLTDASATQREIRDTKRSQGK